MIKSILRRLYKKVRNLQVYNIEIEFWYKKTFNFPKDLNQTQYWSQAGLVYFMLLLMDLLILWNCWFNMVQMWILNVVWYLLPFSLEIVLPFPSGCLPCFIKLGHCVTLISQCPGVGIKLSWTYFFIDTFTPLMAACQSGHHAKNIEDRLVECVEYLIGKGAIVNDHDK